MDMQDKFEKEWGESFEGAEMQPSDGLWNKIELDLVNASNVKYRKRIAFFKMLAAASVFFGLAIAGTAVFQNMGEVSKSELSENSSGEKGNGYIDKVGESNSANTTTLNEESKRLDGTVSNQNSGHFTESVENNELDNVIAQTIKGQNVSSNKDSEVNLVQNTNQDSKEVIASGKQVGSNSNSNVSFQSANDIFSEKKTADPNYKEAGIAYLASSNESSQITDARMVSGMDDRSLIDRIGVDLFKVEPSHQKLAMVPRLAEAYRRNPSSYKGTWAGLGLSGGAYNPTGAIGGGPSTEGLTSDVVNNAFSSSPTLSPEENGRAINIGLNMGTQLSKKWLLQGGVVMTERNTSSTSTVLDKGFRTPTVAPREGADNPVLSRDALKSTDISNTYQLVSVPVQAGYILLDKKFNITLLGGVSNDMLISRKSQADSDTFDSELLNESDFRTYTISGLLGSELSYDIGKQGNYTIALTPQLRQSINSISKSDDSLKPTFMELGFRFRYHIR